MAYTPVDHPEKECLWCSSVFKPNTSHQKFCGRGCYKKYGIKYLGHRSSNQRAVERRKRNGVNVRSKVSKKHYRNYKKDSCEYCHFIPIDKCQLDVDHIDGDHNNNDPSNLQTLCANCHRLKTKLSRDGIYKPK